MNYLYVACMAVWSGVIVWRIVFAGDRELHIRKIAGLESIDEAVGRATEMGRPILFASPSGGMDLPGLSSLAVLSRVARMAARYGTRLIVTAMDYLMYTMAEEICKEAYIAEGKGDLFDPPRDLHFINAQFPYAIGTAGIIHREQVAATFMFGYFNAESLLISEAGNQVGAIQVAGTDAIMQVPFFVVSCDYTLIGEELYAAGAYLSQEKTMMGSLAGQDIVKASVIALLIVGVVVTTWCGVFGYERNPFVEWLVNR